MNITMEDVLFTDALGNKSKFDSFFVQNRLIRSGEKREVKRECSLLMSFIMFVRCVQVPKQINIKEELQKYTESLGAGRGRGRGRG